MSQLTPSKLDSGPRATRLMAPPQLTVSAKTLGSRISFDVPVSNLSRSGILLEWSNSKFTLPFLENTLIEIELEAKFKGQPRRLNALGKVVRRTIDSNKCQYGVRVIHTEDNDHVEWMSMVTSLEKALPRE